jgi:hypothetical protein
LNDHSVSPRQFSWSPDGRYIVFDSFEGPVLWIMDIQSGGKQILTSRQAFAPSWSPIMHIPINIEAIKSLTDCTSGWTRLSAGGKAMVLGSMDDTPNRVRSEPKKGENIIGLLPPGTAMDVLEGPICADGFVFWKVQSFLYIPGWIGWTAEGDGEEYYLEPIDHNN